MNVCGWLFVRNGIKITDRLLNHEEIHTAQMKEDGYIWFYLSYLFFWIRNLFFFGFNHDAYRNIPYEREAFDWSMSSGWVIQAVAWPQKIMP